MRVHIPCAICGHRTRLHSLWTSSGWVCIYWARCTAEELKE